MKETNKICVVGWHFFKDFYSKIKQCDADVFVVSHRHNKILDELEFDYKITKNAGVEFSSYDWYIKNVWDGESGVFFMHDDIDVYENDVINTIKKQIGDSDFVSIKGRTCSKKTKHSNRCFYLSKKMIKHFLSDFNGIWSDPHNHGYTLGKKKYYDKIYSEAYEEDYCSAVGRSFKETVPYILNKYQLKSKILVIKSMVLHRRGLEGEGSIKKLNDNTIFGRDENVLERILSKKELVTDKGRIKHFYTKWYNFYFDKIRKDNLNVLEIGVADGRSLSMWKDYFINSDIYGVEKNKDYVNPKLVKDCNIFYGNQEDRSFLKKVISSIPGGLDIVIDDGSHFSDDQISSFKILFKHLNPGGIYVIEDLQCSYTKKSIRNKNNIMDFLRGLIDGISFSGRTKTMNFERVVNKSIKLGRYERLVCGMSFHPGVCFIFKRFCK